MALNFWGLDLLGWWLAIQFPRMKDYLIAILDLSFSFKDYLISSLDLSFYFFNAFLKIPRNFIPYKPTHPQRKLNNCSTDEEARPKEQKCNCPQRYSPFTTLIPAPSSITGTLGSNRSLHNIEAQKD